MDHIDFAKERNTFVGHFIIKAITARDQKKGLKPCMTVEEILKNKPDSALTEIVLTINGVEVPFVEVVNRISNNMDVYISEKAKELLDEKAMPMYDRLTELLDDMEDRIRDEFDILKSVSLDGS